MGGLRWTHKSTRKIAEVLRKKGFDVSRSTVSRLLKDAEFSLKTNRKRLAGTHDPDRDRQFRLLARRRNQFQRDRQPIVSMDCKKKELVGNFKNHGRAWRRQPRDVFDHDFPSWAEGRAIPFGVYDIAANHGYVVVGTSRETSAFVINALRSWWRRVGRGRYDGATRLGIECDCGGGNGPRLWAWKTGLQDFASEHGLTITVGHFPPGASKWNLIEHRMFSLISENWAGEPLTSYEVILKFIRSTRSTTGFRCRATLDTREHPKKQIVTDEQKAMLRLSPHRTLPKWNYTVKPNDA